MAAYTRTDVPEGGYLYTWDLTTADHTGDALRVGSALEKCLILIASTAGSATAKIEGSHDATNYIALTDPQGNEISKTASGVEQLLETPIMVRPRLTTPGTGAIWIVQLYIPQRRS